MIKTCLFLLIFVFIVLFCIFVFVAFGGLLTLNDMIRMVLINWGFKVFYETIATPVTYGVIDFLKNKEGIDTYDSGLTLNPFFKRSR